VALVVLVVFLFLRNLRATIIPSLSVPLSLIGTLSAMYLLRFNLDNLSLMAFTIATGFVVDDAIVVIENISRYIEMGESPLEAALKGSKQIGFTIVSLTISLIAVHFPLLFMGDVIGRLFHEFSVTLVVTIVLSAVLSLTLVPMMCAKMLRHQEKAGRFERLSLATVDGMIKVYGRMLSWVLRHQGLTLVVATGTLILTIWLYVIVPKGFFPVQDTGLIQGVTQAPQSTSYDAMVKRQGELAKRILSDADVVNLSSLVGVDGSNTTLNSGRFLIGLKPHDERNLSAQDIARRIENESRGVQGINLFLQPVQDLTTETTVSATQYQFVLENADPDELNTWVPKLVSRLQNVPEIMDVASDLQQSGLSARITIDRKSAARFGVTPAAGKHCPPHGTRPFATASGSGRYKRGGVYCFLDQFIAHWRVPADSFDGWNYWPPVSRIHNDPFGCRNDFTGALFNSDADDVFDPAPEREADQNKLVLPERGALLPADARLLRRNVALGAETFSLNTSDLADQYRAEFLSF
jgi:multidrug efflux pump